MKKIDDSVYLKPLMDWYYNSEIKLSKMVLSGEISSSNALKVTEELLRLVIEKADNIVKGCKAYANRI